MFALFYFSDFQAVLSGALASGLDSTLPYSGFIATTAKMNVSFDQQMRRHLCTILNWG